LQEMLSNPAVQGGIAPLLAALVVALLLSRTRFAGLAILAGYAVMIALTTGFSFTPLSVSRKILVIGLAAPLLGLAADVVPRAARVVIPVVALAAALAAVWTFLPVLQNKDATTAWPIAAGLALLVFVLVYATALHRQDGVRTAATGVGLGLAVGVAAVLSASTGLVAALPIAMLAALFSGAILVLASAPWYALPLLALVPLAAAVPVPAGWSTWLRAFAIGACAVAAALPTILAAWYAARGSLG
jgi:hypothetical protein